MPKESDKERLQRIRKKWLEYGDDLLSDTDFWFLNERADRAEKMENEASRLFRDIQMLKDQKHSIRKDRFLLHRALNDVQGFLESHNIGKTKDSAWIDVQEIVNEALAGVPIE